MSDRRHTDKPELNPSDVWSLPANHPAMVENRTLFPSTVIEVTRDEPERLLVSGANNRKLGKTVEKGKFKGYALYGLSLEERATCPTDCKVRGYCYGNGMQMARRHRIGDPDVFFDRLGFEICELLDESEGLLIRLHVLGDFPSVEYVAFWKEVLDEHPKVAAYGYTHWPEESEIGQAIASIKLAHPDRFRIRWSSDQKRPDGAVVIDYVPPVPRVKHGLVCPAQTDATACCSTCGFCWEMASRKDAVVFIKHGRKSSELAAERAMQPNVHSGTSANTRAVAAIDMPPKMRIGSIPGDAPSVRLVAPTDLRIEAAYQRDLSGKSIKLIRKIVSEWDWAKFTPPICADTKDGLFVVDGQHTAIAAASHPGIKTIPILVIDAPALERRAESFVAHNRDRLAMSPLQIFHAELAAKVPSALSIHERAIAAGAMIPRYIPPKAMAKAGQAVSATAMQRIHKTFGPQSLERILRIAVMSKIAPIASTVLYGLQLICCDKRFAHVGRLSDTKIAKAVGSIANIEQAAQKYGAKHGSNRYHAAAALIARAAIQFGASPSPNRGEGSSRSAFPQSKPSPHPFTTGEANGRESESA